ncbi:MAG: hypothetical protein A2428_14335 [Bdellovibrionales bacterium RIFOXYC1_FULL_54_43]|nr:MAG: hypothetical protein A2428_14335 [Bdellovibrionales bacterium RIFOXYC1_FULL_54_43]OFZ83738.1 MAG: hypothetical protein A2603_00245 [Bdellovibrionales bacterium RIFOXYD1_FULL_55_31]
MLKHHHLVATGFALFLGASLVACQDKTLEDWQNEKVGRDTAKIQAVAGIYRGVLVSQWDLSQNSPVAPVEIRLEPKIKSGGSGGSQQQATIQAKVIIGEGSQVKRLNFTANSFNYVDQSFEATASVATGKSDLAVNMQAEISDSGTLQGKFEVDGYSDRGVSFDLVKDAPLGVVDSGSAGRPGIELPEVVYYGETPDLGKPHGVIQIEAMIRTYPMSSGAEFVELISPIKFVEVSWNTGMENPPILEGQLDLSTGRLFAALSIQFEGQPYKVTLDCKMRDPVSLDGGLDCRFDSRMNLHYSVTLLPRVKNAGGNQNK